MSFTVDDSIKVSLLQVGRTLEWHEQATTSGAPAEPSHGVTITDTVTAAVHVALREDPSTKTTRVSVTADGSTTYEVTINDATASYDASTGDGQLSTILAELASTVDGLSGYSATTVDADGDGADDRVEITGDDETGYAVSVSTTGTGTITIEHEDATKASVRLWAKPDGIGFGTLSGPPEEWALVNGAEWALDQRGLTERVMAAGYGRLYLEVADADGDVTAYLARAIEE